MKPQEIFDANRLLAEFMGWKNADPKDCHLSTCMHKDGKFFFIHSFEYHHSWNWLMPVVDKINKINDGYFRCVIMDDECHIDCKSVFADYPETWTDIRSYETSLITAIYYAVVQFLKWYNTWEGKETKSDETT